MSGNFRSPKMDSYRKERWSSCSSIRLPAPLTEIVERRDGSDVQMNGSFAVMTGSG